jgi:hypothetical protein
VPPSNRSGDDRNRERDVDRRVDRRGDHDVDRDVDIDVDRDLGGGLAFDRNSDAGLSRDALGIGHGDFPRAHAMHRERVRERVRERARERNRMRS